MIEERLDKTTRRHWDERMEGKREVTVDTLFGFLQQRVQILERLGVANSQSQSSSRELKAFGSKPGRNNANNNTKAAGRFNSVNSAAFLGFIQRAHRLHWQRQRQRGDVTCVRVPILYILVRHFFGGSLRTRANRYGETAETLLQLFAKRLCSQHV